MNHLAALVALLIFSSLSIAQVQPPADGKALFDAGIQLLREGQIEQAVESFERSAAADPRQPATFMNIGLIRLRLQQFDRAEAAFRSAVRLAPQTGDFHAGLCDALIRQRRHDEALRACDEAVRLAPDSVPANSARLNALLSAGRINEETLQIADALIERFRDQEAILALSAELHMNARNFSRAILILESLTAMRPERAIYHGQLAWLYLKFERETESLSRARRALALDRNDPYGNYAMGQIFFELGQHEEAAEAYARIPEDSRMHSNAAYYRAVSESKRGNQQKAVEILRELVNRSPDSVEYQRRLAENLSELRRYQEAIPVYLKAAALDPEDASIQAGLGMAYMLLAKFDEAIKYFDAALALKPSEPILQQFVNVARTRSRINGHIEDDFRNAELAPDAIEPKLKLVRMLSMLNRIDEAEKYIAEIYRRDPPDPQVFLMIGTAYGEAGREEKAIDAYRRGLAKGENVGLHLGLAGSYGKRGEFEAASAAYSRVIELKPDTPNIMAMYGHLLRNNGKRREALAMYRRSLAQLPNNALVLFEAGILSLKLGEPDAAQSYLGTLKTVDPKLAATLERCIRLKLW